MAIADFRTVDEYIAAQPAEAQAVLKRVRSIILAAVPGAEEVISYKIPAIKVGGKRPVLWFAGWKKHFSLYPVNGSLAEQLKDELAPYELSKGTVRFPLSEKVPEKLIRKIAKLRAHGTAAP